MKPFDLEAAKAGAKIQFADGKQCSFVAHVPQAFFPTSRVVVVDSDGFIQVCRETGKHARLASTLVMAPVTKKVTVYIYKHKDTALIHIADVQAVYRDWTFLKSVEIEYEDE